MLSKIMLVLYYLKLELFIKIRQLVKCSATWKHKPSS